MLTRPLIELSQYGTIIPFDATKDYDLKFLVIGGSQVTKNNLIIYRNDNNSEVYNKTINNFELNHIIPANTLQNGMEYKLKIRTGNYEGNFSDFSDMAIFKCYSTPFMTIKNIVDGKVSNQTYTFEGEYSQYEGEKLLSYKYILYDEHEDIIGISEEKLDKLLKYEFAGLENNSNYYIEIKALTENYREISTGRIPFKAVYFQPKLPSTLNLENVEDEGAVQIKAKIIQIIGHIKEGEIKYEDGEWLDVTKGIVYFDKENGFEINGDFTLQIWCKNLIEDKDFLITILGNNNVELRLVFYDNRIHCFKLINNITYSHYASNTINVSSLETQVYIFMQCINQRIRLRAEII